MKENEKKLFWELCKFKSSDLDEPLLAYATPAVLGQLFFNRMQGVAYDTLRMGGMLGKVNREFRNSLGSAYEQNIFRNQSFFEGVSMLSDILSACDCKVAMLKGAFLCAHYPQGCRTSNDIDLLVLPEDVTTVGDLLSFAGFGQGYIREGKFTPASRKEIVQSKMMRGETVPYVKEVDLPFMKYLEVDINFSLDYKNGNKDVLKAMLDRRTVRREKNLKIPTLEMPDFFLHLCAHLYKEATTLPWIEMHRDMALYKYGDIYLLISEMSATDITGIFHRAEELGLEKVCAYAVLETMELFDMSHDDTWARASEILAQTPAFRLEVVAPEGKKKFVYQTVDVTERFFMEDRARDLVENP